jgi:putative transposase
LLKFAKDRNRYREMLRECLAGFPVGVLNYCITSNHVHLLLRDLRSNGASEIPAFMNRLAGDFAQYYNLRTRRSGAYWGDRYHATMVDGGAHLFRCLKYIDLNMVRAGVVAHPTDWTWTGYAELAGDRKRYRIVDRTLLLKCLQQTNIEGFETNYRIAIQQAIDSGELAREARWTNDLAIGSQAYVDSLSPRIRNRMKVEKKKCTEGPENTWCVREPILSYGRF